MAPEAGPWVRRGRCRQAEEGTKAKKWHSARHSARDTVQVCVCTSVRVCESEHESLQEGSPCNFPLQTLAEPPGPSRPVRDSWEARSQPHRASG